MTNREQTTTLAWERFVLCLLFCCAVVLLFSFLPFFLFFFAALSWLFVFVSIFLFFFSPFFLSFSSSLQPYPGSQFPGISVFYKTTDGKVYRFYSVYARGLDLVNSTHSLHDLLPNGRNGFDARFD
jgi:hypothetical protein